MEKRLTQIINMVRNFLFSSANREFLTFFFFLVLSSIFWLMTALNETYEREVSVPAYLVNVPKNVVITSDMEDTVRVTVRFSHTSTAKACVRLTSTSSRSSHVSRATA